MDKNENLAIMGDFNIDVNNRWHSDKNKLGSFCDAHNLTNLICPETCFKMKNSKITIGLIWTNTPLSFKRTYVTETSLSNYLKLISTLISKSVPLGYTKIKYYRNYKNSMNKAFLRTQKWKILAFQ